MIVRLTDIQRAFDDLIAGARSREKISDWARSRRMENDDGQLLFEPAAMSDQIWRAITYLEGVDMKDSPMSYLHVPEDFIRFRSKLGICSSSSHHVTPMKVLITEVAAVAEQCRISFECGGGRGHALWVGKPPAVGEARHIELEIEAGVVVGKDLIETREPAGILIVEDATVLIGELTAVESDGYVRMEFGCGGVDLEVAGDPPVLGGRYRIVARELRAFDCDY
jgi:hypothetical protein